MPWFRRAPARDPRFDSVLDTLRTLAERLNHVDAAIKALSVPQSAPQSLEPLAGALGQGLVAIASALPKVLDSQMEMASRMSDRVVRSSLSATAADMGRRSGEKRREKAARADVVEKTEQQKQLEQQLAWCAGDCEDCASAIERRDPAHTNDMLRHARDLHRAQRLIPLGIELAS